MSSVVCGKPGPKPTMIRINSSDENYDIIAKILARNLEKRIKIVDAVMCMRYTFQQLKERTKGFVEMGIESGVGKLSFDLNIQVCCYYLVQPNDCDIVVLILPDRLSKYDFSKDRFCRAIMSAKDTVYITYMNSYSKLMQPLFENRHLCKWM